MNKWCLGIWLAVILVAGMLGGCGDIYSKVERNGEFEYVQDKNTDLCFAAYHGHLYTHYACVPCSEKVLARLTTFKYVR